jgi:kinesin family protein 5
MRQIAAKLDAIESDPEAPSLTSEDATQLRRQLAEGQSLVRETVDRLRQKQEEGDLITRRKDELESRLGTLETEYEELLGAHLWLRSVHID